MTAPRLFIDPSSTCCGYAVFDGSRLVECGRVTPDRQRDPANVRIQSMARELHNLAVEKLCPPAVSYHVCSEIVIEDTSGKVGARHGAGGGAGLSIYGKAVGYIWGALRGSEALATADVVMVPENEWTRGKPKANRLQRVAMLHRGLYDPKKDSGGDAGDAVGLGDWWAVCRDGWLATRVPVAPRRRAAGVRVEGGRMERAEGR
jgi:hypothetical protein